jgi:hypothetical protein
MRDVALELHRAMSLNIEDHEEMKPMLGENLGS